MSKESGTYNPEMQEAHLEQEFYKKHLQLVNALREKGGSRKKPSFDRQNIDYSVIATNGEDTDESRLELAVFSIGFSETVKGVGYGLATLIDPDTMFDDTLREYTKITESDQLLKKFDDPVFQKSFNTLLRSVDEGVFIGDEIANAVDPVVDQYIAMGNNRHRLTLSLLGSMDEAYAAVCAGSIPGEE